MKRGIYAGVVVVILMLLFSYLAMVVKRELGDSYEQLVLILGAIIAAVIGIAINQAGN
ncbi:hypothetical protein [Burkholderia phage BCSR5]|nr:hypothetical protein [Burkholderia phage BCSR5]